MLQTSAWAGCVQNGTSFKFNCVILSNPLECEDIDDPNPGCIKNTTKISYQCPDYFCLSRDVEMVAEYEEDNSLDLREVRFFFKVNALRISA